MSDPINPRQVQVTGNHMVTGVITMKEALEREVDKMKQVYDAAMDLSDKLGNLWLGWFIAEDKLPEQYRPIVAAVDALVRECRRAKEGR